METDEKLVEGANGGDVEAFETLYYRYRDWVYRLAMRFSGDHEMAMDVLQETFIYLLSKFPGFKLTAKMTTFLYPAVRHICFNMKRKANRHVGDDEILGELAAPPEARGQGREELASALKKLSQEQREVVLMRFVDSMSLEEMAKALKISASTVKSRLYRGLETLRNDPKTQDYFLE